MSKTCPALPLALFGLLLAACASTPQGSDTAQQKARVMATERAFAKTMADRDLAAFARFVSEEAVFLGDTPLRGRAAVVEGWKRLYQGKQAPFSWAPERVYVIESGTLAVSSGGVFDPQGKRIGTFNSTWRLERDGEWRVVLDLGCPPCRCGEPAVKP